MKNITVMVVIWLGLFASANGQPEQASKPMADSSQIDSTAISMVLRLRPSRPLPSLPPLPRLRQNEQSFSVDVGSRYRSLHPEESTNWDALNLPPNHKFYPNSLPDQPWLMPVTPWQSAQNVISKPLALRDYVLPTRAELDILELLWIKDNVQDTTLYSCLDTTMAITMEDMNRLLEGMIRKGLVSRKIVSPRHEFNAFGVLIEMSAQNRRNRIYQYHALVSRDLMRTFIDANAYLFTRDYSIVNQKQLAAAQKDSSLLLELNRKMQRVFPKAP
ncbi:MAG: hypothetical protein ONB11_09240 [candidate division KSB1 bacterium]|nr:hypothetical protein [candidate division KSB1 bacterium]